MDQSGIGLRICLFLMLGTRLHTIVSLGDTILDSFALSKISDVNPFLLAAPSACVSYCTLTADRHCTYLSSEPVSIGLKDIMVLLSDNR